VLLDPITQTRRRARRSARPPPSCAPPSPHDRTLSLVPPASATG